MSERESFKEPRGAAAGDEALDELSRQILVHEQADSSRSYLGRAVSATWSAAASLAGAGSELTRDRLEDLEKQVARNKASGDEAAISKLTEEVKDRVAADRRALAIENEVAHYSGSLLKTAALFLRGKVGLAGTVALFAADQVRPSDSLRTQLADLSLGAAKGAALRGTFQLAGRANLSVAGRGVALGVSSRVAELSLTRQTYLDPSGSFDGARGLRNVVFGSVSPGALLVDAATFGAAHGLMGVAGRATGGALSRSPFWATALTGSTFGFTTGAWGEFHRQTTAGEGLDLGAVLMRGTMQSAVDGLAAAPAGMQASRLAARSAAGKAEPGASAAAERLKLPSTTSALRGDGSAVISARTVGSGEPTTGRTGASSIQSKKAHAEAAVEPGRQPGQTVVAGSKEQAPFRVREPAGEGGRKIDVAEGKLRSDPVDSGGKRLLLGELSPQEQLARISEIRAETQIQLSPERLNAVRRDINEHGRNPAEVLVELMRSHRILGIGEKHMSPNAHRDFGAAMMPELRKAGATHLALEIYGIHQHILDRFSRTGELSPSDRKQVAGLLGAGDFVRLLESARNSGMKLVAVDSKDSWRDGHMAREIGKILDGDPSAKVVFWVGSQHLAREHPYNREAVQLLREKYRVATVRDALNDRRWKGMPSPLFLAAREITEPVMVSTQAARNVGEMPSNTGVGKFRLWDYVLIHPYRESATRS